MIDDHNCPDSILDSFCFKPPKREPKQNLRIVKHKSTAYHAGGHGGIFPECLYQGPCENDAPREDANMDTWCEFIAKTHVRTTQGDACFATCSVKERADVEDFSQACYESRVELSRDGGLEDASAFPRCIWETNVCHSQIPAQGASMAAWCDYLLNANRDCFVHCRGDQSEDLQSFQAGCRASSELPAHDSTGDR
jgi:hypothetical protein